MKVQVPRWIWVLFALLCISTALILFGSRESQSNPDSDSYAASGVRAYRELLVANGFKTRTARTTLRPANSDETLIAFFFSNEIPEVSNDDWGKEDRVHISLKKHLDSGGNALIIAVPRDFIRASADAQKSNVLIQSKQEAGRQIKVSATSSENTWTDSTGLEYANKDYIVWTKGDEPFAWIDLVGKGKALTLNFGLGAMNRYIDKDQNAEFFLELASLVSGQSGSFVFYEASHGAAQEPSLVETIGGWANGAWWQLNIIFVALICSLGVRFGYPNPFRATQLGGKDFADAIASLLRRSRASSISMEVLVADADREIRRRLKLAMDTPKEVRDRAMPEALADAMKMAENVLRDNPPPSVALSVARRLDLELAKFLHQTERKPAARRKSQ